MKKVIIINAIVISLAILSTYFLVKMSISDDKKIAYINTNKLFDEFSLTKDLKIKINLIEESSKLVLDSLTFALNGLIDLRDKKALEEMAFRIKYDNLYQEIISKEKYFQEHNQTIIQQFDEQILTQLDQYISDYSKEKGYDLVLGTGEGAVLFSVENIEITNQLIEYSNQRFLGENE